MKEQEQIGQEKIDVALELSSAYISIRNAISFLYGLADESDAKDPQAITNARKKAEEAMVWLIQAQSRQEVAVDMNGNFLR